MDQTLDTLILVNSASPGYRKGCQFILPYCDHLGLPYHLVDINQTPLPDDIRSYALVLIAHPSLDRRGTKLGKTGRAKLIDAIQQGCGMVSFDPALPVPLPVSQQVTSSTVEFTQQHFITTHHEVKEILPLASTLKFRPIHDHSPEVILRANGQPFLTSQAVGKGKLVRWATSDWMYSGILGPLGGLDGVFWRSLVWAARKPFALRGLPPLVTMRVDDVAGRGELWNESPLYWVHTANRYGFKPWLGLFIYNLSEPAIDDLRNLIHDGLATAFPHALGRPPRPEHADFYYHPKALALRSSTYDEFIYFDHQHSHSWSDTEAARGLQAVDDWYNAHAPLPISPYALAHWGEMGSNVMAHVRHTWGCDLIAKYNDIDAPLQETPWIVAGPFRKYERPGSALLNEKKRGKRPAYYADFINFTENPFFLCFTEIRDDGGYEWAPDNDVAATTARGFRHLARAIDSMALAVLFTHETDFIYKISPENWEKEIEGIAMAMAAFNPIFVTQEEGIYYVRAIRTSHFDSCQWDGKYKKITAHFSGTADRPTHFYLFTGEHEITASLIDVPAFDKKVEVSFSLT